ncbi:PREDICTED: signal-induced proliferation-associated 1-like protein 3, partial [Gekko japonicus]|uniref:Signal-induced proliferation-associated 1-like protein 3 n=1 Tax=Gekko japonicus TaxID=146911 RepID=A0ABM1JNV5_GEKJA
MTSYRPVRESGDVGGPGLKGGDYYSLGFWAQNGCARHLEGPAAPRLATATPAMPKMGVRARIADWPPKREGLKDPAPPRDPEAPAPVPPRGFQNGQPPGGAVPSGFRGFQRLARRRSKDAEFQDSWLPSPARGLLPLRNRSSSEITLSECDLDEAFEPRGARLAGGLPLFREYGSTSSIDVQGISEQRFYDMLREFRGGTLLPQPLEPGRASQGGRAEARDSQGLPLPGDESSLQHKEKSRKKGPKAEAGGGGESIFRKLRSGRGEQEASRALSDPEEGKGPEGGRAWLCPKSFAHYDTQSMLFDLNAVVARRAYVAQRRNTATGASAASAVSAAVSRSCGLGSLEPPAAAFLSTEELSYKDNLEPDPGDDNSNALLLSCPHFRNETGGQQERNISFSRASAGSPGGGGGEGSPEQACPATYYRSTFCALRTEHSNYFGVDEKLGPVAVSLRREKLEDHREHGPQYQYRIIFRTSELCRKHKVGILYCKASQSSEEEMYNNEEAGPALEEFLELLGEKVCLRGFSKYAAQLDTKTDSTGTHSLYTTYQGYEIMFHVSTMLPYTPNNRQQLLRKRHIGNDIVTIIFQEPGALPFTPQNIRSHFQHVFVIVRAQNPCTENVCYSVAVTRSKDVPPFGPAIPSRATFRKSDVFRDFLLAKVINAENAAHKSDKFHTMATRTRQEYLKDLAENCVTSTPIDSTGKFNLISLASKKKEKTKARAGAEQYSTGAIAWRVWAQDYTQGVEIGCVLGVSNEFVVLLDLAAKEVVFNCFCADVIGWTPDSFAIKVFYGRGDHVFVRALESNPDDIKEIVQRLKVMTSGCETAEMTLRRNGLGQLGFHVKFDGTVAEVEEYGFAWQAGLRQGSRLVEICKVAVVTLSHDQMIDWLRTSVTVKVVIIPPHEDGTPRRGWAETFKASTTEPKVEPESLPVGFRPPYRSHSAWQWTGSATHGSSQASKWGEQPAPGHGQSQSLTRTPKQNAAAPYRETQPLHGKRPVSFPETPHAAAATPAGAERAQAYRQPSGSFSIPASSGTAYSRYKHSPDRYATSCPRPLAPFDPLHGHEVTSNGDSSPGGLASQESTMERPKPEPLWHVPVQNRLSAASGSSVSKRTGRQEPAGKESPNRHSKGEGPSSSSHSSSNTLSSNASSSHSDERWFDTPDPAEADPDPLAKGGSSDSGIDATSAKSLRRDKMPTVSPPYGAALHHGDERWFDPPDPAEADPDPLAKGGSSDSGIDATSAKSLRRDKMPTVSPPYGAALHEGGCQRRESSPGVSSGGQSRGYRPKAFGVGASSVAGRSGGSNNNPFKQPRQVFPLPVPAHLTREAVYETYTRGHSGAQSRFSPQKTIQRTLSDESLCSGRRDATYASAYGFEQPLPGDVLFTSTFPSSTLPVRRQHPPPGPGRGPEKK